MIRPLRTILGTLAALAATAGHAVQLVDEPVALAWMADEVERFADRTFKAIARRAERSGQLGCSRHCARLERIFTRLVAEAKTQSARAVRLPWSLTVVQSADIEAQAVPGGQVIISEAFLDRRTTSDEALAFALAHEMAHSMLEHERQALTFARMLLPRHVARSVSDMYAEMDFSFGVLKAMEPVLQQGEIEADELGLLLASAAGSVARRNSSMKMWSARRSWSAYSGLTSPRMRTPRPGPGNAWR